MKRLPFTRSQTSPYPYSNCNMASSANGSACKVVLASAIAKKLLSEVEAGIRSLERPPRLHGFLANEDPAARMYAEWSKKTCEEK